MSCRAVSSHHSVILEETGPETFTKTEQGCTLSVAAGQLRPVQECVVPGFPFSSYKSSALNVEGPHVSVLLEAGLDL